MLVGGGWYCNCVVISLSLSGVVSPSVQPSIPWLSSVHSCAMNTNSVKIFANFANSCGNCATYHASTHSNHFCCTNHQKLHSYVLTVLTQQNGTFEIRRFYIFMQKKEGIWIIIIVLYIFIFGHKGREFLKFLKLTQLKVKQDFNRNCSACKSFRL